MNHQHAETLRTMLWEHRAYLKSATEPKQCQPDAYVEGERRTIAALEAAIAALSGGGWLPIESAPKDGTVVLLCAPSWLSPGVGAYEDGHWLDCGFGYAPEPTHWQPLPTPPAAHAQAGEGSNG